MKSFSGLYFPKLGLNTERYGVYLRIQFKCWKIWTRKTPNTENFHAISWKELLALHDDIINVIQSSSNLAQDVNFTHIRCSEDVLDVFWTSYVRSIYVLCLRGGASYESPCQKFRCQQSFSWKRSIAFYQNLSLVMIVVINASSLRSLITHNSRLSDRTRKQYKKEYLSSI